MTEEQALAEATQEIENAKPMHKSVNGVTIEYNENDYEIAINDLKNHKLDQYHNGYKFARQLAYKPIPEQLDLLYWDGVNGTTNWQDHIAEVKANNPKPA